MAADSCRIDDIARGDSPKHAEDRVLLGTRPDEMFVITNRQPFWGNPRRVHKKNAFIKISGGIKGAKKDMSDAIIRYRKHVRKHVWFKHFMETVRLEKYRLVGVGIPQVFWSIGRCLSRVAWVNSESRSRSFRIQAFCSVSGRRKGRRVVRRGTKLSKQSFSSGTAHYANRTY